MAHALLSPSGASRWMACTPSARFEENFQDSSSSFAEEGTLAHTLGELLINLALKRITKPAYKKALAKIEESEYYNESMFEYCSDYATFVMEKYNESLAKTKDAQIFLEEKLDLTDYIPNGFGTGDVVIVADGLMRTIDLKYGKGVPVEVVKNKQQMLYALGALKRFDFLYGVDSIEMSIFQPRIGNVASWSISVRDLEDWANLELRPKAKLAHSGEGDFVPGSHCGFCKGKATCKALADYNMELAKHEFKSPNTLSDEAVSDIMTRTKLFVNWIDAVNDYALDQAINHGKKWPGYKVVEGRSNRKYADEEAILQALNNTKGLEAKDYLTAPKLFTITNLEKSLGKDEFNEIVGKFVIKPQGKPVLVVAEDKRPELNSADAAVQDFS